MLGRHIEYLGMLSVLNVNGIGYCAIEEDEHTGRADEVAALHARGNKRLLLFFLFFFPFWDESRLQRTA